MKPATRAQTATPSPWPANSALLRLSASGGIVFSTMFEQLPMSLDINRFRMRLHDKILSHIDRGADRRTHRPFGSSDTHRGPDSVSGARQIHATILLQHAVQRHRPRHPPADADVLPGTRRTLAADQARFEHRQPRLGLRLRRDRLRQQDCQHRFFQLDSPHHRQRRVNGYGISKLTLANTSAPLCPAGA